MSILSQFFGNRSSSVLDTDVDAYVVVVGGGGGGGTSLNNLTAAGGGGAGAIIYGFAPLSFNQTYQVVIGSGGGAGSVGGYSRLGGIVAYGGGAGGNGQEVAFSPSIHMGELGANAGGNGSAASGSQRFPNPIHVYESDLAHKLSRENRSSVYYYDSKGNDVPRYSDRLIVTAGRRGGLGFNGSSSLNGGGGGGAGASMDHLRGQLYGYFLRPVDLSTSNQIGGKGGYGTIIPFFMQRTSSSVYFDNLIYSSAAIPALNDATIKNIYPYTFCGGGSGGSNTNDALPTQDLVYGGGRGGDGNDSPVAAAANSGSGGGGGAASNNFAEFRIGSNGGSGCVMICYPTSGYSAAVTTGSPTLNTSVRPGWRVYKYNSSGTFYLPG